MFKPDESEATRKLMVYKHSPLVLHSDLNLNSEK